VGHGAAAYLARPAEQRYGTKVLHRVARARATPVSVPRLLASVRQ